MEATTQVCAKQVEFDAEGLRKHARGVPSRKGHDGLSRKTKRCRQSRHLFGVERSVCFPSFAPLRKQTSTSCAKSRIAVTSCGRGTSFSPFEFCALAFAFIHVLRDGTYCFHALRTPFPPMNG